MTWIHMETCDKVRYYLGTLKGWYENFYDVDSDVGHEDFDALEYDYDYGLDTADFHWHFGHGYDLVTHAVIALWDYHPVYNGWARVDHWDVYKRWDADNEWVVLFAYDSWL